MSFSRSCIVLVEVLIIFPILHITPMSLRAKRVTFWKDVPLFLMAANWSSKEGSTLHLPPPTPPYFLHVYHSDIHSIIVDYLLSVSSLPDWIGSHLKRGWALELIRLSTLLHYVVLLKSTCLMLLFFLSPLPLSFFSLCVVFQMRLSARWGKAPLGGWWSALTTAGVCQLTLKKQQLSSGVLFPKL